MKIIIHLHTATAKNFADSWKFRFMHPPFCSRKFTYRLRRYFPLSTLPTTAARETFILSSDNVNHLKHFPFFPHIYSHSNAHFSIPSHAHESDERERSLYQQCTRHTTNIFHPIRANQKNRFSSHFIFSIIFFLYTSCAEITLSHFSSLFWWRRTRRPRIKEWRDQFDKIWQKR